MLFREAVNHIRGFRFIAENIPVHSSAGRRRLYDTLFYSDEQLLNKEFEKTERASDALAFFYTGEGSERYSPLLNRLRDIRGTLERLKAKESLSDIEFFEIKELALLTEEIRIVLEKNNVEVVALPDLLKIIEVLDPEGSRIPHFYIYALYDERLEEVRRKLKKEDREDVKSDLREEEGVIEEEVRGRLTDILSSFQAELSEALENLAELDVLLAKAEFTRQYGLCRPVLTKTRCSYKALWHLELSESLRKKGIEFQRIDVAVEACPTVITGANMAGKSVLLKSLMIAQYMVQYGIFAPAIEAEVVLMDEVIVSMGDEQDELKGLSSYAAEMLNINKAIVAVRAGKKVLALIDEPARTTNPEEGRAIAGALLDFLERNSVFAMVTTHYSGLPVKSRKLRVKGFREDRMDALLSANTINRYMDYSLIEDKEESVPHEALRIAEILNIDKELTDQAKLFLNKDGTEK